MMTVATSKTRGIRAAHFKGMFKAAISLGLTALVFYLVFARADISSISLYLRSLSVESLLAVTVLLIVGAGLSVWRMRLIAQDLGYRLTIPDAISALSLGQIAGSFFFQIVGQLMARSAVLARRGMPVPATVTMTFYERVAAAAISFVLAIAGGWYLFGRVTLDLQNGGLVFLKIVVGLLFAISGGAIFAWGAKLKDVVDQGIGRTLPTALLRTLTISGLIQLATMGGYVVAAHTISPGVPVLDLAAASAVVMLAASLPISLAGWGVRELSAVLALGAVGMPAEAALSVAVLIGVTSLLTLGALAIPSIWTETSPAKRALAPPQTTIDYWAALTWTVPVLAATAVFFQLFIPIGMGELNVNLADPLAILGGALFAIRRVSHERQLPTWRLPHGNVDIVVLTLTLAIALLHGAILFGWTPWAVTNRFFGWFVLLSYGATGALLINHAGQDGLMTMLRTVSVVAASIVVVEILLIGLAGFGVSVPPPIMYSRIMGFAQNANALALQLLMALSAALISDFRPRVKLWVVAIIFAGIWFTASRAAFLALPVTLVAAWFLRLLTLRQIAVSAFLCACLVGVLAGVPTIFKGVIAEIVAGGEGPGGSNEVRLASLEPAFQMFLAHPIFGAGLGAYIVEHSRNFQSVLVIHSTPLWILTEMGIVGFLIWCACFGRMFITEFKRATTGDHVAGFLILILVALGTMSIFHDLLYQRSFWLLFGAASALTTFSIRKTAE
jgi:O-antigen ligase